MRRFTFGVAALLAPAALGAAAFADFPIQPQSKLWVEGTSSVRSYRCEAGRVDGSITTRAPEASTEIATLEQNVKTVEIRIPVSALDCSNGTMNGHMRKALASDRAPVIRYRLTKHAVTPTGADAATVRMDGGLTIAGNERPTSVQATVTRDATGTLRVKGSKVIKMSEYGVKPPSLMMGTMKVHDPVTVKFDVVLKQ